MFRALPCFGHGFRWGATHALFYVFKQTALLAALLITLQPGPSWACACGCGLFEVGTSSLFPSGTGGIAYLEYDLSNQNTNWHGSSRASADDNSDKKIRTEFYTAGLNYMFNHDWGVMAAVPYW